MSIDSALEHPWLAQSADHDVVVSPHVLNRLTQFSTTGQPKLL